MTLDVQNASVVAGGETHLPPPFVIDGLHVLPPIETVSSQVTGDDSTVLRYRTSGGRARLVDFAKDFVAAEAAAVVTSGAQYDDGTGFASGYAVWCAVVALQHRPNGAITIAHVLGSVALLASVAKPTLDEIEAALGGSGKRYAILGDILFYRSADTVIDHRVDDERRVAYVDADNKTSTDLAQDDQDGTLGLEYGGAIDFAIDLTSAYAQTAGDQILKAEAPAWPFGGIIGQLEYIPAVDGAGAGADIDLRPNVDNPGAAAAIAADGDDLNLLLAGTAVGTTTSNTRAPGSYTTDPVFKPGATLSVELQAKTTAFTGGSGTLRMHLWKYTRD